MTPTCTISLKILEVPGYVAIIFLLSIKFLLSSQGMQRSHAACNCLQFRSLCYGCHQGNALCKSVPSFVGVAKATVVGLSITCDVHRRLRVGVGLTIRPRGGVVHGRGLCGAIVCRRERSLADCTVFMHP